MKNSRIKSLAYNSNNKLNGIFKYISKITKHKDIHSSKDIHISVESNNTVDNNLITKPLGIPEGGVAYWCSENHQNSWYQIDFRSFKVVVTGYEYHADSGDFFRNWKLLGSNDGCQWTDIDIRKRTDFPSSNYVHETNYYDCSENIRKPFSFIRLQVSGVRKSDSRYYFAIYRLELYGNIFINGICTRMRPRHIINNSCFFVFLIFNC